MKKRKCATLTLFGKGLFTRGRAPAPPPLDGRAGLPLRSSNATGSGEGEHRPFGKELFTHCRAFRGDCSARLSSSFAIDTETCSLALTYHCAMPLGCC